MNSLPRHTLLLVDDHPMMRHGMRQMLELEDDLRVVGEAGNGQEALDLIDSLQPDLVLLDNNMPHMNGLEMLESLQASGGARGVPVLMLTTEAAPALVDRAKKAGAKGWIVKPFKAELLLGAVRKLTAA